MTARRGERARRAEFVTAVEDAEGRALSTEGLGFVIGVLER